MGFLSRLFGFDTTDAAQRVLPEPYEPFMSTAGIPVMDPGTPLEFWTRGDRTEIERFWRSQPNLRKVVDFIARNVASIPLHTYDRVSDTERQRLTDHPLARVVSSPRPGVGPYRFWHSVLSDGLLYDRWLVLKERDDSGNLSLIQVPAWRTKFKTDALNRVTSIAYWQNSQGSGDRWIDVPLDQAIFDHGYAPGGGGLSPVTTLRDILDESAEAVRYRREVWKNAARMPGFVSRPPTAPPWTPDQRDRFVKSLRSAYGRDGSRAGGLPLMEDGMSIESIEVFSPQDAQDLEGRQLTAIEVAAAFHLAPEVVGARAGNYSNMKEFRQSLYRDSLGPYIRSWEEALNAQLVPDLAGGRPLYVEANVKAKLRGSFEEEARIGQASVGVPTTTVNEWRAMNNMAPISGGDDLVRPLNVAYGDQASPQDSGSQNQRTALPPAVKSRIPDQQEDMYAATIRVFFERQEAAVRSRLGAKSPAWWDAERWDEELAEDLRRLSMATTEQAGRKALADLGLDPDRYDVPRTVEYLREVAKGDASRINGTTREQIMAALASAEPDVELERVFEVNRTSRAKQIVGTLITGAVGFAFVEAARQQSPRSTKTWRVNSNNPRSSHARMDGETVGVEETFSNGLKWPGAYGPADEVAGCECSVTITIPEPEEGDE